MICQTCEHYPPLNPQPFMGISKVMENDLLSPSILRESQLTRIVPRTKSWVKKHFVVHVAEGQPPLGLALDYSAVQRVRGNGLVVHVHTEQPSLT